MRMPGRRLGGSLALPWESTAHIESGGANQYFKMGRFARCKQARNWPWLSHLQHLSPTESGDYLKLLSSPVESGGRFAAG